MMQKYLSREIDFKFDIRRNSNFHSYQTRRSNDLRLPRVRTRRQTFSFQASKDWNNQDNDMSNRCPFLRQNQAPKLKTL